MIDYRLLGPFEVAFDGHAVDVGGPKQRALLAILLLHANQLVHRDVLIDLIWGDHPPAGAEHAVDVYIWRLREDPGAGRGTCQCVRRSLAATSSRSARSRSTWRGSSAWPKPGAARWRRRTPVARQLILAKR